MRTFLEFFKAATGYDPYPYQEEFATRDELPSLVSVPTGCGKTAAVILGWLWRRRYDQRADIRKATPRRLVYCLPMRVLVEQTRDCAVIWLDRLDQLGGKATLEKDGDGNERLKDYDPWDAADEPQKIRVHPLMGGDIDRDWDIYPERDAILVGTQDMLLSRALNRGYAMSRYRWPMHFGLLSTDCLWVFDEIQLMGSGLATTVQLGAFRNRLGHNGCASIWMSATLQRDWLKTVDFVDPSVLPLVQLGDHDLQNCDVGKLREARKPIQPATARMDDSKGLATEILDEHQRAGGRTLVVVNTVKKARDLAQQLQRVMKSAESKPDLLLIHSRFRPDDRRRQVRHLLAEPGKHGMIVISTQVVEAGVDVSATTLFTELAPWASLVQRFGRCNRRGTENDKGQVLWIDLPDDGKQHDKLSAPYQTAQLLRSRELLAQRQDVGLASLPQDIILPYEHGQVLRYKDFIELFDTTPDLAGSDIDIQRYVREVEECDVQVFWRDWRAEQSPPEGTAGPRREELCTVPVGEFRDFAQDNRRRKLVFRWDYLDEQWMPVDTGRIFPGQVYLLHATAGGYTSEFGWDAKSTGTVAVLAAPQCAPAPDANDADQLSQSGWQSIADHTDRVCRELDAILSRLEVNGAMALKSAARWHDRGKPHVSFLAKLKPEALAAARTAQLLSGEFPAKAPTDAWVRGRNRNPNHRKHFRHELAAALAVLMADHDQIAADVRDLVAYLVAAHHGKVRLSIRSLPEEVVPPGSRRFARGVWEQDKLPQTDLGGSVLASPVEISLEPMELGLCEQAPFAGQPSWADRMLRLRDDPKLGPFRLAYLEAILRAADARASVKRTPPEANDA
jgi:CRISPR-associated endonuclease/helicase Cas3